MKSEMEFMDGLKQIDVQEDGETEHFYGQHIVAVSVKPDADTIKIFHYTSLHGSPGCGIPHSEGFNFPKSMAKEVAEALLKLLEAK